MPRISTPARLGRVLFVLFVLFGLLGVVAAHHDNEAEHQVTAAAAANSDPTVRVDDLPPTTSRKPPPPTNNMAQPPKQLQIETISIPNNANQLRKATTGDMISVHYTGTLWSNGSKFDSSFDRNSPLPIKLGVGQVIKGWDEGIQGMVVGEKRKLTIPSDKAYGSQGFPPIIPPNSALVFTVEMMSIGSPRSDL